MFNVEIGETIIKFQVEQSGEKHELIHYLRQPSAKEAMDYATSKAGEVRLTESNGYITRPTASLFPARAALYDKIATKAEGYCLSDGTELDCRRPDWKNFIPPAHKYAAIMKWDPSERIEFDEDEEKN